MNGPDEGDVAAYTNDRRFVAGYQVGLRHGFDLGAGVVEEEYLVAADPPEPTPEDRRLGEALRKAPTHQELTDRRYQDSGAPATALRRRAGIHAKRIWSTG